MEVNRLLSDELSYELRVRGASIAGGVDEKRQRLRILLREERLDSNISYDITGLEPQLEIQICESKLDDLESAVKDFNFNNAINENSKIQTRLKHVLGRLNHIFDPTMNLVKVSLLNRCTGLMDSLGLIMSNINNSRSFVQEKSLLDEPNLLLPEVVSRPNTSRIQNFVPVTDLVDVPSVNIDDQHLPPMTRQGQVQYSFISDAHYSSPMGMNNAEVPNIGQIHLPQALPTSHDVLQPPNTNSLSSNVAQHTAAPIGVNRNISHSGEFVSSNHTSCTYPMTINTVTDNTHSQNFPTLRRRDNNYISYRNTGQTVTFAPTVNENLSRAPIMSCEESQNINCNLIGSQSNPNPYLVRCEGNTYLPSSEPVYSLGARMNTNVLLPTNLGNNLNSTSRINNDCQNSFERQIRALNIHDSEVGNHHAPVMVEHSLPVGVEDQSRCFSVVSKWNISKFTGFNNVLDFLEEVEELRIACGLSKAQLFRCVSTLLTDAALIWFRGIKSSITTWDELVLLLKNTYLPTDYEKHLFADILARTQHFNEKSAIYIAIMENYFNRLKRKPAEEERLRIILDNMLPEIQKKLALRPVNSLSELVENCKGIEDVFWRTEHWRPPPSNPRVVTDANLMYRRPKVHELEPVHAVASEQPTARQIPTSGVATRIVTCWNCRQQGHVKRDCKQTPSMHCYRCGRQGVTIRNCQSCSGNDPLGHH